MKSTKITKHFVSVIASCLTLVTLPSTAITDSATLPNHAYATSTTSLNNSLKSDEVFSEAELAQMLAPIALYPDALLSHILISSTYPIEVIDADRWLTKHQHLSVKARADKAEDIDWDPSVKALLAFPKIINKLSNDLLWMRNLGDAFLQDEAKVLASIQSLRLKADQAGNLSSMNNVNIVRETKTIIIEPAKPDIIYVPYYDTRVVYGNWHWRHYPPVYWHRPAHYVHHRGHYYWHNPVRLSIGLIFGNVHWHNRHVVVHRYKSRYYKRHTNKRVSTSYQAQRWQHKPQRRHGVAYRSSHIQKKYKHRNLHADVRKTRHKELKTHLKRNKAVKVRNHKIDVHKKSKQQFSHHTSHKNKVRNNKAVYKNEKWQKRNISERTKVKKLAQHKSARKVTSTNVTKVKTKNRTVKKTHHKTVKSNRHKVSRSKHNRTAKKSVNRTQKKHH